MEKIMRVMGKWSLSSFINFWVEFAWAGFLVALVIYIIMLILQVTGILPFLGLPIKFPVKLASDTIDLNLSPMQLHLVELNATFATGLISWNRAWIYLLSVSLQISIFILFLYGLSQLKAILKSLKEEKPFEAENIIRLRKIAFLVFIVTPVQLIYSLISFWYVSSFESLSEFIQLSVEFDYEYLLIGLGIFVIAEIFKISTRMHKEQQLTV